MEIVIGIVLVAFGILQIILFFKIWGMTNDIRAIKYKYLSKNTSQNIPDLPNDPNSFKENDLVVSIKTGKQMRIKGFTDDGRYSCYTNSGMNHEGDFRKDELELFGQ